MRRMTLGVTAGWTALAASIVVAGTIVSTPARAETPAVDPAAVQVLKRMTEYLGGLKQFSVHTRNSIEDLLDSGQRVDELVSANVVISRPNKLRAERIGDSVNQVFYYNGKELTLYEPPSNVYATVQAPTTIEGTLDYARQSLGLHVPAADLVYSDAFQLLMHDVTSAIVVGKGGVGGVECIHLAFRRPGVDFQVWVADTGHPLPYGYVVTDTSTPALISVVTVMSDWNVAPDVADARFTFVPPEGAVPIEFLPPDTSVVSSR